MPLCDGGPCERPRFSIFACYAGGKAFWLRIEMSYGLHRLRKIAGSVAFLILLASITPALSFGSLHRLRDTTEVSTVLSFDSTNDLIVINVNLNGKGPYRFLLDSGASHNVIKPQLAQLLALAIKDGGVIDTGGLEKVRAGLVKVAEVRAGNFILKSQPFFVTTLPASYPFDGFLGAGIFKRFVIQIDFQHSLLTLIHPSAFHYEGQGAAIPLRFYEKLIPQIEAEVDGNYGWFKLDTGYNGSLALFREFIDEHRLLAKYVPQKAGPGGRTLAGEVGDSPVAQIQMLKLGDIVLQNLPASLFLEKGGSNSAFAGAIGTGILKQMLVTLDYGKRRMILERTESSRTSN